LGDLYRQADEKYNAGLFDFRADTLTKTVTIDDKVLKPILAGLYYPQSPYEFSVLPAEILGQVYEQFLGKVIRLTPGHRAKVEEKPEVKKAGGVYYTPTYIVDYIVQQTVGQLVEGKTPHQISKLRILDPACGSGSFLLGAYQYLLDYHRQWYEEHDPVKHARGKRPALYQGPRGDWRLTTAEKKRILLNNIYGVDIDRQAVEVTKLSLLLKVLEGESQETLGQQLALWRERALPDLGNNIKCGNSLIGPDYLEAQLLPDEEEMRRVNPFDWEAEFSEAMAAGGFDAVIGNPPYGIPFQAKELSYLQEELPQARKLPDSYCLFMVKSLQLLRKDGMLSFIVPNTFCDLENCDLFREWLLTNHRLERIWQSGWAFRSAIVNTLVFVISKERPDEDDVVSITVYDRRYKRSNTQFLANQLYKIDYRNSEEDRNILKKVSKHESIVAVDSLAIVKAGVKMYERGKGQPPQTAETLKNRPYSRKGERPENWRPLYRGKHVTRYYLKPTQEFVNYGPWLAAPRNPELFDSPKILMRRTDDHLMSSLEEEYAICVNSCHVIKIKESYKDLSYAYILA